ncbi:SDR family oxidoreductase [Streptomyces sp. NBC_01275]|uniref:SDR family NAD(P)-dependent oxidoreductase n=1 Tax=Streptomyces sp. NBC_01275 TaxID=2903807 RepID=UPI00224F428A|nr:SDR family oxidoreductase [Streptomyces sp. NBC_01275]MCX4766606.1 SDR family oxidoreductase [Streptomyces sp. NBC_01275]
MGYADELFDLTGRVVVITGGSRGLGRATAFGAARCGADVVVASRRYDACADVCREIEKETGRTALPHAVHVGRWDELPGLVDAVYERFGRLDALVNNAGMSPVYDDLTTVTEKMFDAVVGLNLKGPFRLSVLAGARMAAAGGGTIVNVSSTGSIRPRPAIVPYAAAKAGLNAVTVGLAKALGPTVRVNTLMCGPFATWATQGWQDAPEQLAEGVRPHALERIGDPEEIVGAALYLLSDASSYTSGATLRVDGGMP